MNNTTFPPLTTTLPPPSNYSGQAITDYPDACVTLSGVSCVLSFFGALGIFVTYGLLPDIRNVTRKLILCLTLADLFTAIGYLISVYRYAVITTGSSNTDGTEPTMHDLCIIQSAITTYSSIASFLLTIFIAIHVTWTLVHRQNRTGTTCAFVMFNIISWTIPGIVIGLSLWRGALGEDKKTTAATGPWCWVNTDMDNVIWWMLLDGKGWELSCFLITASIFVLLKYYKFLTHRLHDVHENLRDEDSNVLYLWFVMYVVRIWGTLRFLIYAFKPDISKDNPGMIVLLFLQAIGDPAQAFCNFTLFCVLDKTVQTHMKRWLRSLRGRMACKPASGGLLSEDHTEPKEVYIASRSQQTNYDSINYVSRRDTNRSLTASELESFT